MIKEYFDAQISDFLRIVEPRRKHDSYKTGFSLVVRDCYGTRPTGPILGKSRHTESKFLKINVKIFDFEPFGLPINFLHFIIYNRCP